jgi:hypothetical protein
MKRLLLAMLCVFAAAASFGRDGKHIMIRVNVN